MLAVAVEAAERLLEEETEDSGILAPAGQTELRFWHLSFQEYLAAREIARLSEAEQNDRVVKSGRLYQGEWRETMRLLGGVLKQQGVAKIEGLFVAILGNRTGTLGGEACCAGLLGSMMRDLSGMGYEPQAPEYRQVLRSLDRIFEAGESETIPFQDRGLEAAEALGQAGDSRLEHANWIEIPAGSFWMGAQPSHPRERNYDSMADPQESPYGSPHSDQMIVEERYHRLDHDHLEMILNITDPKTYVGT